jgi:2-polyprenyl-3-methyl-5-hydroxy-6-metoxy-1,4-benzoquinol methylase
MYKGEKMSWEDDQKWETDWWGDCLNTHGEEDKQRHYAERMGLVKLGDARHSFYYDLRGVSVLDVGGGPVSLLLKCHKRGKCKVIDPGQYPKWIAERYKCAEIEYAQAKGEDIDDTGYDEVWIYNVLQHVDDPVAIIENAKKAGKIIRVFEWLEIGVAPGHPHNLLEGKMNEWFGGEGKVFAEEGARGKEYYGVFVGDTYEE